MQDALYIISIKRGNNSIFLFLNKKKVSYFPFQYGNIKADVGSPRET